MLIVFFLLILALCGFILLVCCYWRDIYFNSIRELVESVSYGPSSHGTKRGTTGLVEDRCFQLMAQMVNCPDNKDGSRREK